MSIVKIQLRYLVGTLSVYRPVSESYVSPTRQVRAKVYDYEDLVVMPIICLRDAQGQRNLCYLEGFWNVVERYTIVKKKVKS